MALTAVYIEPSGQDWFTFKRIVEKTKIMKKETLSSPLNLIFYHLTLYRKSADAVELRFHSKENQLGLS